jgi:ABC-type Zn uptake system ZnuABC Zn-binding protein ZnuA
MIRISLFTILIIFSLLIAACQPAPAAAPVAPAAPGAAAPAGFPSGAVLATAPFLAEIAQNVAGDRLTVASLLPSGIDPHGFEPSPSDAARVANSQVLIINGGGFEEFVESLLENAGGERLVIEAAHGLDDRAADEDHDDEDEADHDEDEAAEDEHGHEGDPHFWLDPSNVIQYVKNIRAGLTQFDPEGADVYAANAESYIAQLEELDAWIQAQIEQIPSERRLMVTNHESFGYYADRYGLTIIGAVIPSVATGASPSARELSRLIEQIRDTGAPAIFLETGANPRLAEQVASETGAKIAPELYSHSITPAGGAAPTYIDMMKYNTQVIVDALK